MTQEGYVSRLIDLCLQLCAAPYLFRSSQADPEKVMMYISVLIYAVY